MLSKARIKTDKSLCQWIQNHYFRPFESLNISFIYWLRFYFGVFGLYSSGRGGKSRMLQSQTQNGLSAQCLAHGLSFRNKENSQVNSLVLFCCRESQISCESTFTEVLYWSSILTLLCFTWVFPFSAILYFPIFWRQIFYLYLLIFADYMQRQSQNNAF